jgi:hypothetical protein
LRGIFFNFQPPFESFILPYRDFHYQPQRLDADWPSPQIVSLVFPQPGLQPDPKYVFHFWQHPVTMPCW